MIIGVGNDIVDMRRMRRALARQPRRLPMRILTAAERERTGNSPAVFLAGRWAAKEALGKALGRGLRAPLTWRQISVCNGADGRPFFVFAAAAARYLAERKARECHLSISHDGDYALATVIVEGGD